MKRKNFILLTIAGAGAWMAPSCSPPNTAALGRPLFLSAICDPQTLRRIGTDYRTRTPGEAGESRLVHLLTAGLPTGGDPSRQLDNTIKQDYAAGRTLIIDGWVLSITEARQCALYSLQKS